MITGYCVSVHSGIYLCGHSAGAHLATMMLMSSFQHDDAFDSELIKGKKKLSYRFSVHANSATYFRVDALAVFYC